jgi:leucyl aminopeptidase (aminopeptidase T)
MSNKQRALQAAKTIITRCLALPPESELAIVMDETTLKIATLLAETACACGCQPHLLYFPIELQKHLAHRTLGESMRAALREVAATIVCVNGAPDCFAFRDHIRRAAWGRGRRVAHMPGINWRTLLMADTDYDLLTRRCTDLALALVKGREIKIESFDRHGRTHVLSAALSPWRRLPIISDGVIHDGAWGNVPSGETYIAPVEGTAEGEIVINGALPGRVLTPVEELVLRFEAGRMIQVIPARSAAARHLLDAQLGYARTQGDANWNCLAEIGFGVNERIRALTGTPLLDEKRYGSVHIALGDNRDMGGILKSRVHCDMVCLRPTVSVDGKLILQDGKIVLAEDDWREDYRAVPVRRNSQIRITPTAVDGRVDAEGRLQRLWDTSSGRVCAVPVGNEESTRLAAHVWRILRERERVSLEDLARLARIADQQTLLQLVHLLESYGLASLDEEKSV